MRRAPTLSPSGFHSAHTIAISLAQSEKPAAVRGVALIDYLIGPRTARAMAPLATVDLVGWDVHQAIVDNVFANTNDEARHCFEMPAYMKRALERGCLGDKTPEQGGFY